MHSGQAASLLMQSQNEAHSVAPADGVAVVTAIVVVTATVAVTATVVVTTIVLDSLTNRTTDSLGNEVSAAGEDTEVVHRTSIIETGVTGVLELILKTRNVQLKTKPAIDVVD